MVHSLIIERYERLIINNKEKAMRILLLSILTSLVFAQTAQVQTGHNSPSPVAITIYDLMGNVVSDLFSGTEGPGYKSISWDATNNNGDLVSSGMYFYKLQVGESFEIKRMMYLK